MGIEKDELDLRLEAQLDRELRSQLDRQRGRATPYFLARCRGRAARRGWHRSIVRFAAVAAACCAGLFVWRQTRPAPAPVRPDKKTVVLATPAAAQVEKADGATSSEPGRAIGVGTISQRDGAEEAPDFASGAAARQPLVLGRALSTRTLDEGTLLVGRTLVRKVRRQWLERVEWFDPQNGARVQRIVPHEEVLFVPLPAN